MKIVIEVNDYEELINFCKDIVGKEAAPGKKESSSRRAPVKKAAAPVEEEPAEEKEVAAPVKEEPAVTYTKVDVRAKLKELQEAGKRVEVKALLNEFAASGRLSDIKEEDYAALMEKAGEM